MRKIGGVLLVGLGVILILFGIFRILDVLVVFFSAEQSTYGAGFVAGTLVAVVLIVAVGREAIKKGRKFFDPSENPEATGK